jgi:hypothetical protein
VPWDIPAQANQVEGLSAPTGGSMMRSPIVVLCLVIGLIGLGLAPSSAAEKKTSQQGQQQMMKACTDQANAKNLSGDAKKNFIATCMKNG